MPYQVMQRGSKWVVVKADSGRVLGTHPTKEAAQEQVRAIYANEKRRKGKGGSPR